MSSLVGSSLLVLLIRVGGAALQLLLVALAVWLFPIREVGLNGILWTCAVIARGVGPIGADLYVLREMTPIWDGNERAHFFAMCRGISLGLARVLVLPLLLITGALVAASVIGRVPWSLSLVLPVVILASVAQRLWSNQMRAQGRVMLSQFAEGLMVPVLAVVFLLGSAAVDARTLLYGQALAIVLGAAVLWALLMRGQDKSVRYRMDRHIWRAILPLGAGTGLSVLAARLPILFVGSYSAVQAAHYDIGQRVHSAATLASQSAATVFLPRVRRLVHDGNGRQLARELATSTAVGLVPAVLVTCALLLVGPERTEELLGAEYTGTWAVALLLSVAAVLNAATGLCHGLLAMTGHARAFLVIAAVQCVVVLGYGLFLFTGSAVEMAWFFVGAEFFRSMLLVTLAVRVFRSLPVSRITPARELDPQDQVLEVPSQTAREEGRHP